MNDCQNIRDTLHVEPNATEVLLHLRACERCERYAQRFARLDAVLRVQLVTSAPATVAASVPAVIADSQWRRLDVILRAELVVEAPAALCVQLARLARPVMAPIDAVLRSQLVLDAPAALSARLQQLVLQPQPAPVIVAAPPQRRWLVNTVYALTAILLFASLFYAGQIYSLVIAQFGLQAWVASLAATPAAALELLYQYVPQSQLVIGMLARLQQPLQWLLVGLIMWAVIDMSQRQGRYDQQVPETMRA